jgi:hypothetical protein
MHASTASFLEGGPGRSPYLKPLEYSSFAASIIYSSAHFLSKRNDEYNLLQLTANEVSGPIKFAKAMIAFRLLF